MNLGIFLVVVYYMFAMPIPTKVKGARCVRLEIKIKQPEKFNRQLPDGEFPPPRRGWVFVKH